MALVENNRYIVQVRVFFAVSLAISTLSGSESRKEIDMLFD